MAAEVLRRVPSHMPYNVTTGGPRRRFRHRPPIFPVYPAAITDSRVCTNHQQRIEWEDYARMSSTVERKEFLEARLSDPDETEPRVRPPVLAAAPLQHALRQA